MSAAGTLIIGAGQAGVELAAALRTAGDDGPITLVGSERHEPYQRPPLSKSFLKGDDAVADLLLRDEAWFAAHGISVLSGETVTSVERLADGSGTATTATGRELDFSTLALATGAEPRRLNVPGSDAPGVHYLRGIDDAEAIARELGGAPDVVVIGGGFIGLEVAATARNAGCTTTVLEASPRLIGRAVCAETSEFYLSAVRRRGTAVHTLVAIDGFTLTAGRVSGVRFTDADGTPSEIPAALVLIGIGVVPCTGLAEALGLEVENGVVVDGRMLASDALTIAVGDAVNMPLPGGARGTLERVRLESVPNATEQARIAASTLTGGNESYVAVPWFWSDQGELKLQIAGLSHGYDQVVLRGNPRSEKFSVLYYRDGSIIAADCVNSPRDFMAVKTALRTSVALPAGLAADPALALKELLRARPVVAP